MSVGQRHAVLYLILLAVVFQALIVLLQLFAPQIAQYWIPSDSSRAFGIFQQPNVLASFIATGLALALAAFLLPGFSLVQPRAEYWRRCAVDRGVGGAANGIGVGTIPYWLAGGDLSAGAVCPVLWPPLFAGCSHFDSASYRRRHSGFGIVVGQ
ncbi:Lipid A core - O-antigen ligase and related enzymes [Serratia fonticola]|uniref:Lipid A core - O-antigen ligase and related enzymes n=1 Tax=Serratia fonticola TaxID=47917 RepID=A0A4U9U9U4_SERFO|nr:Lipid A core - O-antigen ligase and related enzymes [Serratia fonticola]